LDEGNVIEHLLHMCLRVKVIIVDENIDLFGIVDTYTIQLWWCPTYLQTHYYVEDALPATIK